MGEVPVALIAYVQIELPDGYNPDGNSVSLLDGDDPDGSVLLHTFEQISKSDELSDLACAFEALAKLHRKNYPDTRITYTTMQLPEQEL